MRAWLRGRRAQRGRRVRRREEQVQAPGHAAARSDADERNGVASGHGGRRGSTRACAGYVVWVLARTERLQCNERKSIDAEPGTACRRSLRSAPARTTTALRTNQRDRGVPAIVRFADELADNPRVGGLSGRSHEGLTWRGPAEAGPLLKLSGRLAHRLAVKRIILSTCQTRIGRNAASSFVTRIRAGSTHAASATPFRPVALSPAPSSRRRCRRNARTLP